MNTGSGRPGHHEGALTPEERALADRIARLGPQGEPSPALDARILAAARAATSAPATAGSARTAPRRRQRRWPVAFGAAATLAIVGGLAWQLRPVDDLQVEYSEAPRAASGPSADAEPAPRRVERAVRTPTDAAAQPAVAAAPAAGNAAPATGQPSPIPAPPAESTQPEASVEAPAAADAAPRPEAFSRKREVPAEPPVVFDEPSPMDTPAPTQEPPRPAPPPPAPPAPPPPAAQAQAAIVLPPPAATRDAAATAGNAVESAAAARAQRVKAVDTSARHAAAHVASGATAQSAKPASAGAAADASALDRIEVTGVRIEDENRAEYAGDQPLDDQPPASVDSPQVRQAWLQRVRQLVAEGRPDAARDSLREYQRRYPKATLPDDLRALLDE